MADFFTRVPGPLEVMRRLGLNVPSSKQVGKFSTAVPEFVGPQADVAGMVRDAGQVMPNIQAGDYGQALGNLGMAAAAIPFMAFPGTIASVKKGAKGLFGPTGGPLLAGVAKAGIKGSVDPLTLRAMGGGATKAKGVDVPYTKLKLKKEEIDEFDTGRIYEPSDKYIKPKITTPSDLQGGYLTNLYGDRSDIGILAGIKGKLFDDPVILDGGHGYMRGEGTGAWASHPNVITKISNKVRSAEGDPVFGAYVPMSGEATDFATMTLKVAFNNFNLKSLTKKDIKDFNKTLKNTTKDFPGLDNPKFDDWANKTGVNRYDLMKELAKSKWRDKGFPDVAAARHAVQDPDLRMLPAGNEALGGQSIARINPEGVMTPVSELPMPHTTYQMDLAGDYLGGLKNPVPRSHLFPDWFGARRAMDAPISADNKSFMSNVLLQPTNQKWVDTVSKILEGQGK